MPLQFERAPSAGSAAAANGHGSCVASIDMLDIVFTVATVAFFALATAYASACDRL